MGKPLEIYRSSRAKNVKYKEIFSPNWHAFHLTITACRRRRIVTPAPFSLPFLKILPYSLLRTQNTTAARAVCTVVIQLPCYSADYAK